MRSLFLIIAIFISVFSYAQHITATIVTTKDECVKGTAEVKITDGADPFTFLWSNGGTTREVKDLSVGDYWVKITDSNNRDTILYTTIEAQECIAVAPNYFTPNDDGYNDTWSISHLDVYPDFELNVYNRWGQLVHYQHKEFTPWTGKSLGIIPVADGAYYYILFYDVSNKEKFIKGSVSIVR